MESRELLQPQAFRSDRSSKVRGRADRLMVLLLFVAAFLVVASFERQSRAKGFNRLDTRRVRLDTAGRWWDRRWSDWLGAKLNALEQVDVDDPIQVGQLIEELDSLPFLAEVGVAETLWPNGLRVPIRPVDVVACVRVGRHFQPVSHSGVLLPGRWPVPPPAGSGFLPVIGPLDDVDGDANQHGGAGLSASVWLEVRPGERLNSQTFDWALNIAGSLWAHLDARSLELLGPVVIDARRAKATSPTEPGARLYLEHGREVWFGRAPGMDEPGELPATSKWRSLSQALSLLNADDAEASGRIALDWQLVDLRWDRPELGLRPGAEWPTPAEPARSLPRIHTSSNADALVRGSRGLMPLPTSKPADTLERDPNAVSEGERTNTKKPSRVQ